MFNMLLSRSSLSSLFYENKEIKVVETNDLSSIIEAFLNDLFEKIKIENEPTKKQTLHRVLYTHLKDILATEIFTVVTPAFAALACTLAVQVAAMRGYISYPDPYKNTSYYPLFQRHVATSPLNLHYTYSEHIEKVLETHGYNTMWIGLHHYIANAKPTVIEVSTEKGPARLIQDEARFPKKITSQKDFLAQLNEKNCQQQTALALALCYEKMNLAGEIYCRLYPSLSAVLAARMVDMINAAEIFNPVSFEDELTTFIDALYRHLALMPSPQSMDNLYHWAIHHANRLMVSDLNNIKTWAANPLSDVQKETFEPYIIQPRSSENPWLSPQRASSEVDEVLEVLATLLDRLKDDRARAKFLSTGLTFTPALLCTLSFKIAFDSVGSQTKDEPVQRKDLFQYHIEAYDDAFNVISGPSISMQDLTAWELRLYELMGWVTVCSPYLPSKTSHAAPNSDPDPWLKSTCTLM